MRLNRYLREEEALQVGEPEPGEEYTPEEVADKLEKLQIAIGKQAELIKKLGKSNSNEDKLEAARSIMKDLKDKLDKWENWKEEVKSKGPNPEPAMAGGEEPPVEEEPEEEEPEEEEEEEEEK